MNLQNTQVPSKLEQHTIDFTKRKIALISGFSAIDMFGHLFDLHPMQIERLRNTEKICNTILYDQLCRDLLPGGAGIELRGRSVAIAQVEQSLSVLFRSQSTFWETYYSRKNHRSHTCNRDKSLTELSLMEITQIARYCYPCFFTTLDAMFYGDGQQQQDYTIIGLSLQAFLKACFLELCAYEEQSTDAFENALKLIGPVNVPGYRDYLMECIQQ